MTRDGFDRLPTCRLLGLAFAAVELETVLRCLLDRDPAAPFAYVVTPNADHLVRLHRRPGLRPAYDGAALHLLDSRVVRRAARALGLPAPPVVPGSDLVAQLLRRLPPGERLTVVGLPPEWVPALAACCGIGVPVHLDPPAGFEHDPDAMCAAVRFVQAHPARFVLLAVGSPRQELLAASIAACGAVGGIGICVGAGLDFLAGRRRRAPAWMQGASLEWLHRLGSEPRRLGRRYLRDDPAIFSLLLQERLRLHGCAGGRMGSVVTDEAGTEFCQPLNQGGAGGG